MSSEEKFEYFTETDALLDVTLSNEAKVLYLMGLRPYVSREGVVGNHSKRSFDSVCDLLTQYRSSDGEERGLKPVFKPTSGQVRGYWRQLEKVGLVVKLEEIDRGGRHLFRLPLVNLELLGWALDGMETQGYSGRSPVMWW